MAEDQTRPDLEDVKINIRALLSSNKMDMTYATLIAEYEELAFNPMPLCGFPTRVALINSIPDVVQVIPGTPNRLRLVHSHMSGHVAKLVRQQKASNKPKKQFPSYSRLANLGINMPIRTERQASIKCQATPILAKQNIVESKYKWPPVRELFQKKIEDKINETAKNEGLSADLESYNNSQDIIHPRNVTELQKLSRNSGYQCNADNKSDLSQKQVQKDYFKQNVDLLFLDLII